MWKAAFTGRSERASERDKGTGDSASTSTPRRPRRSDSDAVSVVSSSSRPVDSDKKKPISEKREERRERRNERHGTAAPRLTESAVRALGEDDEWEDDEQDARGERTSKRAGKSPSEREKTETKREKERVSAREGERERDRREDKDRKRKTSERIPSLSDKARSKSRVGDIVDAPGADRAIPAMGSFEQFPGMYDASVVRPPEPTEATMSGALPYDPHVQHQFPGQDPVGFASSAFDPNPHGEAADYYLDQGESVTHQPGVRPSTPMMLVNPQTHLITPSATANPIADTGHGSAADFYSGKVSPVPFEGTSSRPPARMSGSNSNRPSKTSTGATVAAAAVTAGALGNLVGKNSNRPSSNQYQSASSSSYYQSAFGNDIQQSSAGPSAFGSYLPPKPNRHNSEPVLMSGGGIYAGPPAITGKPGKSSSQSNHAGIYAAAGAAAIGAAAYEMGQHHSGPAHASSQYGSGGGGGAGRPPLGPGDSVSYYSTGVQHHHEHRGPMTRLKDGLLNLVSDPDDVRRMEEYTEYIGVCKHCFDPRSSPLEGPRKHHYHPRQRDSFESLRRRSAERLRQRSSRERIGVSSRIEKESRYTASESSRKQKGMSKTDMAGLGVLGSAGAAVAGAALWHDGKGFDDTYSVKSGHRASSAVRTRSRSSSRERRRRSTQGIIGPNRQEKERWATVRLRDGRIEKRRVTAPSRSRSRERSQDRKSSLIGPAAGVVLGAAGRSEAGRRSTRHGRERDEKGFVRRRTGGRSRSRSNSPSFGDNFSSTSGGKRYRRTRKRSPAASSHDISRRDSNGAESGIFGGFFAEPKKRKDRRREKKEKSFFAFGNGSESSSDSGLAFGAGFSSRSSLGRASKRKAAARRNSEERLTAAVAGIGATAAALAAAQKGHRIPKRALKHELGSRKEAAESVEERHAGQRVEDDEWEDELPSNVDDASSAESGLAFGDDPRPGRMSRRSTDSLASNSSAGGLGAWGWRWGSKKEKKKPRREDVPPQPPRPSRRSDANVAGPIGAGIAAAAASPPSPYESFGGRPPPMQQVDPRPLNDRGSEPGSRHASMPGAFDSPPLVRPGPGILQQPQPIAPISPAFTQGEMDDPTISASFRPPRPRRTQSSPVRNGSGNFMQDAALIGGAALATAGIIASQSKRSKEPGNVRFGLTEEQQRKDEQMRRREGEREEEERRSAARIKALKEEAQRVAREEDDRRSKEARDRERAAAATAAAAAAAAEEEVRRRATAQRQAEEQAENIRQQQRESREREEAYRRDQARTAEEADRITQRPRESEESARFNKEDRERRDKGYRSEQARIAEEHQQQDQVNGFVEEDTLRRREKERQRHVEKGDRFDHERSEGRKQKDSGAAAWEAPVAAGMAGAVAGAVLDGALHQGTHERDHDEPIAESYAAQTIEPTDEHSGAPITDDDLFDPDFFKRKRSPSDLTRAAERARRATRDIVAEREAYYNSPSQTAAEVFAPKELLDRSATGKERVTDPFGGNDVQVYQSTDREVREHFEHPIYNKQGPIDWRRNVPTLNVIAPTPPPLDRSSISKDKQAIDAPSTGEPNRDDSARSKRRGAQGRGVSWGEDSTHVYNVQTPESQIDRDSYVGAQDLSDSRHSVHDDVIVEEDDADGAPKTTRYNKGDLAQRQKLPTAPESSEPFTKVDEDVEEVPRDQQDNEPDDFAYKRPFYESVSDLASGIYPTAAQTPAPFHGFVEGEVDDATPKDEKTPKMPGGFEDDDNAERSKLDRMQDVDDASEKKRETKASATTASAPVNITFDTVAAAAAASKELSRNSQIPDYEPAEESPHSIEKKKREKAAKKSSSAEDSAPPSATFEPEPVPEPSPAEFDDQPTDYFLSKKDKKKREKAAKRKITADDLPTASGAANEKEPISTPVGELRDEVEETSLSEKDKKKRDRKATKGKNFDQDASPVPGAAAREGPRPEDTMGAESPSQESSWELPLSKKEQKEQKKREKEAKKRGFAFDQDTSPAPTAGERDEPQTEDVVDTETPPQRSAWELPLSKKEQKEQKKREKEAKKRGFGDLVGSVMTAGGITALADIAADSGELLDNTDQPTSKSQDEQSVNIPSKDKKDKKSKKKRLGEPFDRDIRDVEPDFPPAPEPGLDPQRSAASTDSTEAYRNNMPGGWDDGDMPRKSPTASEGEETARGNDPSVDAADNSGDLGGFGPVRSKKAKKTRDRRPFNEPTVSSPLRSEVPTKDTSRDHSPEAERQILSTFDDASYTNGHGEENKDLESDAALDPGPLPSGQEAFQGKRFEHQREQQHAEDEGLVGSPQAMYPIDDEHSVASLPADKGRTVKRSKSKRNSDDYVNEPYAFDERSISTSEPTDNYDSARPAKRRSQYAEDDARSESRHEKGSAPLAAKEKKGGVLGSIFGRKSSDTTASSRRSTMESRSIREGDDMDKPRRNRRQRTESEDDDGNDTRSVTSTSSRKHRDERDRDEGGRERYSRRHTEDEPETPRDQHRYRPDGLETRESSKASDQSFLGKRVEDLPPLPASTPASPVATPVKGEQGFGTPASAKALEADPISHDTEPALEGAQRQTELVSAAPWEGDFDDLPPLPESRPESPIAHMETLYRPGIPVRPVTSPTAVPLRFRTMSGSPHIKEGFASMDSPAEMLPSSPVSVPRPKPNRPRSADVREFMPLYLAERYSKPVEDNDEGLPSLPSSKPSSRASSVHGREEDYFDVDETHRFLPSGKELVIDTSAANQPHSSEDWLDSQETTPKASDFPPPGLDKHPKQEPQFYTWEDLMREQYRHAPQEGDQADAQQSSSRDARIESDLELENLPALPTSQPASPSQKENENSDESRKSLATALALGGGVAALAAAYESEDQKDTVGPAETQSHDMEPAIRATSEEWSDIKPRGSNKTGKKAKAMAADETATKSEVPEFEPSEPASSKRQSDLFRAGSDLEGGSVERPSDVAQMGLIQEEIGSERFFEAEKETEQGHGPVFSASSQEPEPYSHTGTMAEPDTNSLIVMEKRLEVGSTEGPEPSISESKAESPDAELPNRTEHEGQEREDLADIEVQSTPLTKESEAEDAFFAPVLPKKQSKKSKKKLKGRAAFNWEDESSQTNLDDSEKLPLDVATKDESTKQATPHATDSTGAAPIDAGTSNDSAALAAIKFTDPPADSDPVEATSKKGKKGKKKKQQKLDLWAKPDPELISTRVSEAERSLDEDATHAADDRDQEPASVADSIAHESTDLPVDQQTPASTDVPGIVELPRATEDEYSALKASEESRSEEDLQTVPDQGSESVEQHFESGKAPRTAPAETLGSTPEDQDAVAGGFWATPAKGKKKKAKKAKKNAKEESTASTAEPRFDVDGTTPIAESQDDRLIEPVADGIDEIDWATPFEGKKSKGSNENKQAVSRLAPEATSTTVDDVAPPSTTPSRSDHRFTVTSPEELPHSEDPSCGKDAEVLPEYSDEARSAEKIPVEDINSGSSQLRDVSKMDLAEHETFPPLPESPVSAPSEPNLAVSGAEDRQTSISSATSGQHRADENQVPKGLEQEPEAASKDVLPTEEPEEFSSFYTLKSKKEKKKAKKAKANDAKKSGSQPEITSSFEAEQLAEEAVVASSAAAAAIAADHGRREEATWEETPRKHSKKEKRKARLGGSEMPESEDSPGSQVPNSQRQLPPAEREPSSLPGSPSAEVSTVGEPIDSSPSQPATAVDHHYHEASQIPIPEDSVDDWQGHHSAGPRPDWDQPTALQDAHRYDSERRENRKVSPASEERHTGRSPDGHDIDFAATLAAGLAGSGFDPSLVVEDPTFHRRASPPSRLAEADPEETSETTVSKRKKGKGKRSDRASETKIPAASANAPAPLEREPIADDFDSTLSRGLQESGFDANLLQSAVDSSRDASAGELQDEPGEFSFVNPRRKKAKKGQQTQKSADESTSAASEAPISASWDSSGARDEGRQVTTESDHSRQPKVTPEEPLAPRGLPADEAPVTGQDNEMTNPMITANAEEEQLTEPVKKRGAKSKRKAQFQIGSSSGTTSTVPTTEDDTTAPASEAELAGTIGSTPTGGAASMFGGDGEMDIDEMDRAYKAYKRNKRKQKKEKAAAEAATALPGAEEAKDLGTVSERRAVDDEPARESDHKRRSEEEVGAPEAWDKPDQSGRQHDDGRGFKPSDAFKDSPLRRSPLGTGNIVEQARQTSPSSKVGFDNLPDQGHEYSLDQSEAGHARGLSTDSTESPGVMVHTSEASQSLPQLVDKSPQRGERMATDGISTPIEETMQQSLDMEKRRRSRIDESNKHERETSRDGLGLVGATAIAAAGATLTSHSSDGKIKAHSTESGAEDTLREPSPQPTWSFSALHTENRPSAESPSLTDEARQIARDSGYHEASSPSSKRESSVRMSSELPSIRQIASKESLTSRRSLEPLHVDVPNAQDWSVRVPKRRADGDEERRDEDAGSRAASYETPLEPTSRNRASYLFSSPRDGAFDQRSSETPTTPRQGPGSTDHFRSPVEDSTHFDPAESARSAKISPSQGPLSPSLPMDTIQEESSATKRSMAAASIGAPERERKSLRRTDTPKAFKDQGLLLGGSRRDRSASDHASLDEAANDRGPADLNAKSLATLDRDMRGAPSKRVASDPRPPSVLSNRSNVSAGMHKTPEELRSYSRASNGSGSTPGLRRISMSGDLRAASRASNRRGDAGSGVGARASPTTIPFEPPPTPPLLNDEDVHVVGAGAPRAVDMADIYQGYGDGQSAHTSPSRPPSMRKRQSMHIMDLEMKLDQLVAENQEIHEARSGRDDTAGQGLHEALEARELELREKNAEIHRIRAMLEPMRDELDRLSDINSGLTEANKNLVDDTNGRYATLQAEHAHAHERWQSTSRELEDVRQQHGRLTTGMRDAIAAEMSAALADRNSEIRKLREELDVATERIRALQVQIQTSKAADFLVQRDEDYIDGACQKLCQHAQQWVLRFSKSSDNRICRLSTDIKDDKIEARLDNCILDGSDVDRLLGDRVRRRDVFMSVTTTMIWEYVFTRYLFGMDREQRQKLKALEKTLSEVGPPRAVAQWRATTLTLLSKRPAFADQCAMDTEAVAHEIIGVLSALLPPPSQAEQQLLVSLQKVITVAVELSIEMRCQRAEYIMLPPLQPEYDTNGELVRKMHFNASLMNERSGAFGSNEELETERAVVKIVLFPPVVKKGDDFGEGAEEIVVCPAQVLVHNDGGRGKKVVRMMSGAMEIDDLRVSRQSLVSTAPGNEASVSGIGGL